MRVLYFARIRQLAGKMSEDVDVPATVTTIRDLIDFLSARDEGVAAALADQRTLRVAIDQQHSSLDASLGSAREVAFFPPVTGG
jgi:molybdopterin synthase sulfur carrier subunit